MPGRPGVPVYQATFKWEGTYLFPTILKWSSAQVPWYISAQCTMMS